MNLQFGVSKTKKKDRRFAVGDILGNIVITKELPWSSRHLCRGFWWYEIKCDCGKSEEVNQGQLVAGKTQCTECGKRPISKKTEHVENVELRNAFIRLPAPSSVSGPDSF